MEAVSQSNGKRFEGKNRDDNAPEICRKPMDILLCPFLFIHSANFSRHPKCPSSRLVRIRKKIFLFYCKASLANLIFYQKFNYCYTVVVHQSTQFLKSEVARSPVVDLLDFIFPTTIPNRSAGEPFQTPDTSVFPVPSLLIPIPVVKKLSTCLPPSAGMRSISPAG